MNIKMYLQKKATKIIKDCSLSIWGGTLFQRDA